MAVKEKEPYCPKCGGDLDRDGVATGLGIEGELGPWYCTECEWSEDDDYDHEDKSLNTFE